MSTDYTIACFTCQIECEEIFASASIAYGFKLWEIGDRTKEFFGHRQPIGNHEGHDIRIVSEDCELPWRGAK